MFSRMEEQEMKKIAEQRRREKMEEKMARCLTYTNYRATLFLDPVTVIQTDSLLSKPTRL